ncbi:hypothetical protein SARC_03400 [Sphaeroforma arctica JP610]|uniref:tRNA (N(6)-L-threonylcarbamoyladenosine(37)-C(2))-methylthiotransferase n=1 Tax=Sphaeroforma arctica JP610 TaxID=667725 RepID=A0A0L0G608_9EUKA|nr:hypothetical protein SARC_03400 [Sphaeroforma arctica JP610]KNC84384.1 hypothetical protein SARC_03400 [Sphaeroforma arctica JP610]|eukprot:XP_014158286.1 hypothetical protein SARC_03400 [Sphaeroforma arctica JP610]
MLTLCSICISRAPSGYHITNTAEEAALWVLNSCTVKNPSEQSLQGAIQKAKDSDRRVVIAGCVSQGAPGTYQGYSIVGVQQIDRIVEVVEETLKGHSVRLLKEKKQDGSDGGKKTRAGGAALSLPKIRKNPLIEIVPISTGCLNQCTYCKTKHARGELGSYPLEEIVNRVEEVLAEGVVEELASYLIDNVPHMTVSTDIICGFPTETAEEFEETLDLIKKYKFPVLNISKFYPRPGTPAANMKKVNTLECKQRSRAATILFNSYQIYTPERIGLEYMVLVTDVSSDGNYWVAHNQSFEQILIPKLDQYLGKYIRVQITEIGKFYMKADVLEESVEKAPYVPPPLPFGQVSGGQKTPKTQKPQLGQVVQEIKSKQKSLYVAVAAVAVYVLIKFVRRYLTSGSSALT